MPINKNLGGKIVAAQEAKNPFAQSWAGREEGPKNTLEPEERGTLIIIIVTVCRY